MREIPFELTNRHGEPIHGDVRFVEGGASRPVVVVCHGFKGFKDWGTFPAFGRHLADQGFVAVQFNFSRNGVSSEQPTEFTRLDRFAENTFTRELEDLGDVLDAVVEGRLPGPYDAARLGLVGHSRGGGIAILTAAADDRVRALVSWSAVSGFIERFTPAQIEDWRTKGFTEVLNMRTGQVMRLGHVLYDDALANRDRLDIRASAARIAVPWLLVHAEDDVPVPFAEAEALRAAQPRARLYRARGGHTFGGKHPFDGTLPGTLRDVFDQTSAFLREVL